MEKQEHHSPTSAHWHKPTDGEHRWPVTLIVLIVVVLQLMLPKSLALSTQKYICAVEILLMVAMFAVNPKRISKHVIQVRALGIALAATMSLSNTVSVVLLIKALVTRGITDAQSLLLTGGSIWITNIVIFALWYWEMDRGGPGARAEAIDPYPDFLFPQMSDPAYAPKDWSPSFFDYLYTSVTNGSAFSPTDVMPLTRPAKMLMVVQSTTALVTVGLVIARAVNILR